MNTTDFLRQLRRQVRSQLALVQQEFATLSSEVLNHSPAPGAWSILACLEHLNRYSHYYLPAFDKALYAQPETQTIREVKKSRLGNWCIASVEPANQKKQKTFQRMNPQHERLTRDTLHTFVLHQEHLLALLDQATHMSLNKRHIPLEFFPWVRLRSGEALAFVITHQERHLQQALRAKQQFSDQTELHTVG